MQLVLSFSVLLGSILVALSAPSGVEALPTRRYNGMVTLPLTPLRQRSDVHPKVLLQQHINRSNRRLARMTRRTAPSEESMRDALVKRVALLEQEGVLVPRYNRQGVPGAAKVKTAAAGLIQTSNLKAGKGGKNAAVAGGVAAGAAAGAAGAGAAATASAGGQVSTSNVTPANKPSDSDTLGLNIEGDDVGYLATVQMGTPPRDFLILMDSGSADLWVGSENCQSEAGGGCGNHVFLGAKSSSSFVDTEKPFQVSYGTGNVAGNITTDNLNIAGLALNKHTFGVATTESVDFSSNNVPFDGLMGLAKSALSQQGVPTPVESLATAGLINQAITSFKIPRLADGKNDGEITFGDVDKSKFDAATLVTLPNVNSDGFWEASLDAVSADGKDLGLKGRTTILDTGTTLMQIPTQDAITLHNAIPGAKSDGQGGFTVPCDTTTSIALTYQGQDFAIDPRDIAFQADPNDPTTCSSGISAASVGGANEWLVGDTFLKNAYFSTNVQKNTIQLAKLV
ncbi:hypothetical protein EVG20_g6965 [Dentipellis fragilis]|uniref:Peptidase A1 domain-containing protein n=1 Tax=Dentipellis fragilis TaxID=205917 RepID=A0A4Y9YHS2_9AGAM|nr:hypothetical protein EVG20_g6965 [Dentipellis fragilis]